jgi:hypothetical protein
MKSLVEFAASRWLSYGLPHFFEAAELAGEAGNTLTFQLYRRPAWVVPAIMQLLPRMCSIQMTIL